ncbi:MAG: hypothetical protein Q7S44_03485 [bacterium]|nr:hypothetical protein [bacterium]
MELAEFRQEKIKGRGELFAKVISTLKEEQPIAIHQFGSGTNGYRDELSDMDMWFTFDDLRVNDVITRRDEIFSKIGKILIKSEPPQNAPLGGKYSLVIFDTDHGLYHVDFYLSKHSQTNIRPDAIFLHGTDEIPRGEWIMDKDAKTNETLEETMNQTITMAFILIKAIIRGGWNDTHANYLRALYQDVQRIAGKRPESLPDTSDFTFLNSLLDNLITDSDEKQKIALAKIKDYANKVKNLYLLPNDKK